MSLLRAMQGLLAAASAPPVVSDPYWVNYQALMHFDGADASTSMVDQSGRTWTANGNAQLDTAQFMFGTASLLLDGTGDFVSSTDQTYSLAGNTECNFECFVRQTNNTGLKAIITKRPPASSSEYAFYMEDGKVRLLVWNAGVTLIDITGTTVLPLNTWGHAAFSNVAGTWRIFLNGNLEASAVTGSLISSNANSTLIGRDVTNVARDFNGWIDELRFVRNQAIYTASFTPPVAPFTNGMTVALLHLDGVDTSTSFPDQRFKTWTAGGNAQVDTAFFQFPTGSALFNGSGDFISTPTNVDFGFGLGDYTIEGFARRTDATAVDRPIIELRAAGGEPALFYLLPTTRVLGYFSTALNLSGGVATTLNAFDHVAWSRESGVLRAFINGVQQWSFAAADNFGTTRPCRIGGNFNASSSFNGHLDEIRITKAAARYTANFTPPSAPFPNGP